MIAAVAFLGLGRMGAPRAANLAAAGHQRILYNRTAATAATAAALAAMGAQVIHRGDTGTGSLVKLAVNHVTYALGNALSESLVLAERAGLDREFVYDVFEHRAVAAPMVGYRPRAYLVPEDTPAAFAMTLARKDLGVITELAATGGLQLTQAEVNLSLYDRAIATGPGEGDMADTAVYPRRSAAPS